MTETVKSYCRLCQAFCGYEVTVEDGRITRLRGDRSDPVSLGYACFKGLRAAEFIRDEKRLLGPLKRDGTSLAPVDSKRLFQEAGERLARIIAQSGPEAVGFFVGTQAYFNALATTFTSAFAAALKTPKVFTTMTIDQSAKWIAPARMGDWQAGSQPFEEADVWMFAGANPMNTMVAGAGANLFGFYHPLEKMRRAKSRGMKLIVIDPRASETARLADLHLQVRPGWDSELAASLLHVVLREGWIDQDFCRDYVDGLEALATALAPFTPECVAPLAGIAARDIEAAAAMFARDGSRGMVGTGTGPDMSRHSNTAEHLYQLLNVVCGRFPREGDAIPNPGVLRSKPVPTADVIPPTREWESSARTRVNGLGTIRGTMMSAELTNEMLHEGEGRLRALIVVGGNPQVALPDQAKAEAALARLDLLVVIDPVLSGTAKLADYVIAPKVYYERADHTLYLEHMFPRPYAHVTAPVVQPPPGSDVVDEWYALWRLAQAAGIALDIDGFDFQTNQAPSTEQLLAHIARNSALPYEEIASRGQGAVFAVPEVRVGARRGQVRFQVFPADVAREVTGIAAAL
ncbi:MAG: molybdopterin-dependent oxidoreductase, partial [Parahaliea sp.]